MFGGPVTPSMEEQKQPGSSQGTPPSINTQLSPELNHVLEKILHVDPTSSLVARILVSEEIKEVEDFVLLTEDDIDNLNLNGESIKVVQKRKLKNILKWHHEPAFPHVQSEWLQLTAFQLQAVTKNIMQPRTPIVPPATQLWQHLPQL